MIINIQISFNASITRQDGNLGT